MLISNIVSLGSIPIFLHRTSVRRSMKTKNMLALSGLFVVCLATNAFSETKFFTHTPYLSEADTPADFFCNLCDDCFTGLETFEDNSIDFGLIIEATNGDIIGPDFSTGVDRLTDSVDGDGPGSIDGVGNDGYSYFSPRNEI